MQQSILREILRVDSNRQIHINVNVPRDMGDEFEVIVLPVRSQSGMSEFTDETRFMLAAYSAVTPDDPEEDAIWEKYIHG